MAPSSEFLELVREIRESQRELLDFTKKWKDESDRRHQEWKEQVAQAAPGVALWEKGNELYLKATESYLKEAERYPRISKGVLVLRLMTIAMLGLIAAAVWLK